MTRRKNEEDICGGGSHSRRGGIKMEEQKRLEEAILSFIEKTTKEPVSEKSVEILPALAHELIELWKS